MSKRQFICVYRKQPNGAIVSEGLGMHSFTNDALNEVCNRGRLPSISHFHHLEVYEVMSEHLVGTYLSEGVAKYRDMAEAHAARIRGGTLKPSVKLDSTSSTTPVQNAIAEMESAMAELAAEKAAKIKERFAVSVVVPTYKIKVAT